MKRTERTYYGFQMTPIFPGQMDVVTTRKPSDMRGVLKTRAANTAEAREKLNREWRHSCGEIINVRNQEEYRTWQS